MWNVELTTKIADAAIIAQNIPPKLCSSTIAGNTPEDMAQQDAVQLQMATPGKPFRFFDLPAELRNLVYGMIAREQTAVLERHRVSDQSKLLDIAELRDEYFPVLMLYAHQIFC